MDEKLITKAAEAAVRNLQLEDCEVASVSRRKEAWCVKFSGSYGEFCDEFRSQFGEENSAEVVREKIKRHLLKSPKPTGRRKGIQNRRPAGSESSLLDFPLQIAGGALEQTARLAGEVIGGTINAAETLIKTATDAASATAQTLTEPTQAQASLSIAASEDVTPPPPPPTIAEIHPGPEKSVAAKSAKGARKTSKKAARKAGKKAASKTSRKRASKK